MTFDFTDDDRDTLRVLPSAPDAVLIAIGSRRQEPRVSDVRIPLDRVEEVVAGIRDAARTAAARQTAGQDDTKPAPWTADGRHGPTPAEMADRRIPTCYVQFMGGAHCATAPAVGQPAEAQATDEAEQLVPVGWWCWRGDNHGHLADIPCRSDNVPIHVPAEWADEMRAVVQHLTDEHEPGEDCTWVTPEEQAAETQAAADTVEDER